MIAIRMDYLYFPVHYSDRDAWKPIGDPNYLENKTYDDPISDLTLYVQWPEFQPRAPSNDQSFLASRASFEPSDWIFISVVNDYSPPNPPIVPDNGLARVLRHMLNTLGKSKIRLPGEQESRLYPEIRYKLYGEDPILDLQKALPIGHGTEEAWTGNEALYWRGDSALFVDTLIICGNGALRNKKSDHRCKHKFVLPEMRANVAVTYSINWLPQWKLIEDRAREYLLSLRVNHSEQPVEKREFKQ